MGVHTLSAPVTCYQEKRETIQETHTPLVQILPYQSQNNYLPLKQEPTTLKLDCGWWLAAVTIFEFSN